MDGLSGSIKTNKKIQNMYSVLKDQGKLHKL